MRIADRMYCVFTGNPFLVTAPLSWRDRIRLRLFLLHMLLMRLRESRVLCVFVVCVCGTMVSAAQCRGGRRGKCH